MLDALGGGLSLDACRTVSEASRSLDPALTLSFTLFGDVGDVDDIGEVGGVDCWLGSLESSTGMLPFACFSVESAGLVGVRGTDKELGSQSSLPTLTCPSTAFDEIGPENQSKTELASCGTSGLLRVGDAGPAARAGCG
jgi:hypothetical protein|mmetsp:Transcript_21848/g.56018  ORF Transcript_21848/g.56018 Transcript_21848/m.56018 type:complete len:139 (+) Transcript_21848:236-652(+)